MANEVNIDLLGTSHNQHLAIAPIEVSTACLAFGRKALRLRFDHNLLAALLCGCHKGRSRLISLGVDANQPDQDGDTAPLTVLCAPDIKYRHLLSSGADLA